MYARTFYFFAFETDLLIYTFFIQPVYKFVLLRYFYIHVRIGQMGFFAWLHVIWKQIMYHMDDTLWVR